MNVQLRDDLSTANPDDAIIVAARGDYSTESMLDVSATEALESSEKDKKAFIESLFRRGHLGPAEHPQAFIAIEGMSIACERQLTRHRHMSFDIQSLRYTEPSDADTLWPDSFSDLDEQQQREVEGYYQDAFEGYKMLTSWDVPVEDARMVLPLGMKINGTMSANLRAYFHLIDMRLAGDAQAEIRELARKVKDELADWAPLSMDVYENRVKGSSKKAP